MEGGYGLVLDEGGVLTAWMTDPASRTEQVRINTPLRAAEWYFVAATFDAQSARLARVSGAAAHVATGPDQCDRDGRDPALAVSGFTLHDTEKTMTLSQQGSPEQATACLVGLVKDLINTDADP